MNALLVSHVDFRAGEAVIIDDRFPIRKDTDRGTRLPIFLNSRSHNEFWALIFEKALAKYYGSYANIDGGLVHIAL